MLHSFILFTLAKHSKTLGAYKLARSAFDRLQTLHVKQPLRRTIEMQSLAIRSTPFHDSEVSKNKILVSRCWPL